LNTIEKRFISDNYNTKDLDNREEQIIKTEKMIITFTMIENQKNNMNNNITIRDLGECEILLRNYLFIIFYNYIIYI